MKFWLMWLRRLLRFVRPATPRIFLDTNVTRKYPALTERLAPLLSFLFTAPILVPGVPSHK